MSNEFGDVIAEFAGLEQTLTVEVLSDTPIDDEGYVTEDFASSVQVVGILLPRSRFNYTGAGFELAGSVFLYISTNQEDYPALGIGDVITDSSGVTWKIVSERDYQDTGFTKIFGLEKDFE